MRIRTVGEQLTFYDEEGNIIIQIPNTPPDLSIDEERMINIVDYMDTLRGKDPNEKPEFFTDLDELEKFIEEHKAVKDKGLYKYVNVDAVIIMMVMIAFFLGVGILGYMTGGALLEKWGINM